MVTCRRNYQIQLSKYVELNKSPTPRRADKYCQVLSTPFSLQCFEVHQDPPRARYPSEGPLASASVDAYTRYFHHRVIECLQHARQCKFILVIADLTFNSNGVVYLAENR